MRKNLTILFSFVLIAALLSGCASAAFAQSSTPAAASGEQAVAEPVNRTITVTGTGKVFLTPDIAYVTIGVHTEGSEAAQAVAENNAKTQKVIDTLKAEGVAEKDIQTTNFSIYPQPVYDDQGKPTGEIKYTVDNSVVVTVRDITKIGDLLDAVVQAGANNINGIQFDVADKTAALSAARQGAVQDAKTKADELASAAGVSVGEVQTMSEYSSGGGVTYDMAAKAMPVMAEAAVPVPVAPGQMQITVDVNIVYGIQ